MTEQYFNYTPRVVNTFKLFGFHSETHDLKFNIAVSPDFRFLSPVVIYRQQILNSSFIKWSDLLIQ